MMTKNTKYYKKINKYESLHFITFLLFFNDLG